MVEQVVATDPGTAQSITQTFAKVAELGLTQHQALRILAASAEPMKVPQVGAQMGLHDNSVREILTTLQEMGLVSRHRGESTGRGRPPWLYTATVNSDPALIAKEFGNFATAVAEQLTKISPTPEEMAEEIGCAWGRQILANQAIPDHSGYDTATAVKHNLATHSAKLRVFLSQLGFEARPGDDPSTINLFQCPLINGFTPNARIVCHVHQGMLNHVIGTLSNHRLEAQLEPFAQPDHCAVHLKTNR